MSEARTVPKFATEKEEADWWYDHREQHAQEFVQAAAEGRVKRGNLADHFAALRGAKTINLHDRAALEVNELAERRGMDASEVVKLLVHDALEQEKRILSAKA